MSGELAAKLCVDPPTCSTITALTAKPVSWPIDAEPPPASRADKPIGLRFTQINSEFCPHGMDESASPDFGCFCEVARHGRREALEARLIEARLN